MKPLTSPRKRLRHTAWDLEWYPHTCELRIAGVYDERGYRHYTSIADFLEGECTSRNAGRWYYAHAGGLYDLRFVLEHVLRVSRNVTAKGAFSGSSCVFLTLQKGKHKWHFVDSYWLIRQPLRDIGAWMGYPKGGNNQKTECKFGLNGDKECKCDPVFFAPIHQLVDYNARDCELLWRAIATVEDTIWDFGGDIKGTIASTAMALFRRKYLDRVIEIPRAVNVWCREAYRASRVEPFKRITGPGKYWDINSAFPANMLRALPARYKGVSKRIPKRGHYVADVTVTVPESYIPPLPWRDSKDRRVYFPTGTWRARYGKVDLEFLERVGGRIDKVHMALCFDEFDNLSQFATDLYEWKKRAIGNLAEYYTVKILINGGYGKFAERSEKVELRIRPKSTKCPHGGRHPDDGLPGSCWEYLSAGAWLHHTDRAVPHEHVAIADAITAGAREDLYDYMSQASEVYYCDTDGFGTPVSDSFPTGDELGELKLEKTFTAAEFAGPKMYILKGTEKGTITKGRGYPRLTSDGFGRLLSGEAWQFEQFARIKGALRKGDITPSQDWTERVFHTGAEAPRAKRCELKDGSTRPWTVEELEGKSEYND